ncbi:MAG: response regulator transcription factor [Chitinophagales bacterium]|nr:response regulator transcription factor [Bacteroidota bacterium]MBP8916458.1 response regulator transcription factor [Chitinophagales bacterium]MBP9220262.1 response regulator transcription factor [Chitinophagales bacterium]MBP9796614.1 response regulator transcription factor [Chitinophagales bacterium]
MKLLVIEDDKTMRENIVHFLQKENYLIETAQDLNTALDKVNIYTYDCILLDITLPDGSGFEILRELKKMNKTDGVIIISAKDSLDDKLSGLDLGADDYLPKPFHMAELNARIKSVLRRRKFEGSEMIVLNNMTVDSASRLVFINGIELVLNRKEYDILLYFLSNKNRLVAKTALAENVWGDNIDSADSFEFIYSQIRNLRKKLKENKAEIEIQAIYGIGYKLITA